MRTLLRSLFISTFSLCGSVAFAQTGTLGSVVANVWVRVTADPTGTCTPSPAAYALYNTANAHMWGCVPNGLVGAWTRLDGSGGGGSINAVLRNQTNTYSGGGGSLQDMSAVLLRVPVIAGYIPTVDGHFGFDSSSHTFRGGSNGSTQLFAWLLPSTPITTGDCVKWLGPNQLGDAGAACGTGSGATTNAPQTFSVTTTTSGGAVVLNHKLGTNAVLVKCWDASGVDVLHKVTRSDINNVSVTFLGAFTGTCLVNGGIGPAGPTGPPGAGSNYNQQVLANGSGAVQRTNLNFVAGSNMTITSSDNGSNQTTLTFASTGGGSGAGTVNTGSQYQLAYYAANGSAVSGSNTLTWQNNTLSMGQNGSGVNGTLVLQGGSSSSATIAVDSSSGRLNLGSPNAYVTAGGALTVTGCTGCGTGGGGGSIVTGTLASLPATCTVGALYFATDQPAQQQLYECDSTNSWTQNVGLGGSGALSVVNGYLDINTAIVPRTGAANTYTGLNKFLALQISGSTSSPGCTGAADVGKVWQNVTDPTNTSFQMCETVNNATQWTAGGGTGGALPSSWAVNSIGGITITSGGTGNSFVTRILTNAAAWVQDFYRTDDGQQWNLGATGSAAGAAQLHDGFFLYDSKTASMLLNAYATSDNITLAANSFASGTIPVDKGDTLQVYPSFGVYTTSGTTLFHVSSGGVVTVPFKANTGTNYVCVDTNGNLIKSTTACSGT